MIPKADLAKAPYPTSWILNEKNILSETRQTVMVLPSFVLFER